jgi:CheY-like chemotaxis protein/HPt (histidine-containing phosphotransfer) domain-containing protein
VLLADDSPDHRRLIAELLARAGAEADVAEDAPHAVAKVRARTFDVVLIDLQLPQANGPAAARALRGAGFDGPVVAFTANALAGDRQRCLEAGCDEYLTKPVDADLLVRTVAALARATPDDEAAPVRDGDRPGRAPEPIRSELADEAALASVLEAFVAGLPKQLDAMCEALANGHHEELKRRAHQLKGAGGSYGYPALTDAAGALEQVARTRDLEVAQLALQQVTVLCQAIADGHAADRPADAADPPAT